MKTCSSCRKIKNIQEFNNNRAAKDGRDNQCKACSRATKSAWKKANRAKCNAQMRNAYANNPGKGADRRRMQEALRLQRTPGWLTELQKSHIRMFYTTSAKLSKEFGIKMHVDHIIPLRGKTVSGLHVPWNLQVIPAVENQKKSNKVTS